MDGLPPQLQSQHLKFIRDTSSPVENPNPSSYSILNTKRNATQQDIYASIKTDESSVHSSVQSIQTGPRRHASIEKSMPNSARNITNTQEDRNEKSLDMNDSNSSQHKITIKKVILSLHRLDLLINS